MEVVTGITFKQIFEDNWQRFIELCNKPIRPAISENVLKMLMCRTEVLGYSQYTCHKCSQSVRINHSCKSRFCSSCGKKSTDQWMATNFQQLPDTTWQHITFTFPCEVWPFFWHNRELMNLIPKFAANIIKKLAADKKASVGIYLAVHTFGRDLKRNFHVHLSTTCIGMSNNGDKLIKLFFNHAPIKRMWRYQCIKLLRELYKKGELTLPSNLSYIRNYTSFNGFLNMLYNKQWVVHMNKQSRNHLHNIQYIGRYLKKPPISETRIKMYDGLNVKFEYMDHYTGAITSITMDVMAFISKLIRHIHDRHFRAIRYYGFLSNRLRSKLLPIFSNLIGNKKRAAAKVTFRSLFIKTFGVDPLQCIKCKVQMLPSLFVFLKQSINVMVYKQIAVN